MESFKMTMKNGDNKNINNMIGSDTVETEMLLDWEDQVTVSVGGQYEFVKGAFARVGYNYGNNPVPDTTVFPVFPAVVEHHVALGGGYNVKDFFEINAAYELALANTQKAADDHEIASEYDGSESTLGEHTVHVMFSFDF
jgi:long-chain fatty acid transport protein